MKACLLPRWNLAPRDAIRLQERLRDRVIDEDRFGAIRTVAGADLAFAGDTAFAGIVVFHLNGLEEIERCFVRRRLRFPYIPGLLSFRECPALLAAFARLRTEPDLVLIDGHGQAHPRLFGIACHMGVLLDKPTIGCAKSRLVGEHEKPGARAGKAAPLMFKGRRVGVALRTRDNTNPIYVTVGHRVSLDSAVRLVRCCLDGFRIPKPTREADHYVRGLRMAYQAEKAARPEATGSADLRC
ncbi:MAG: deoxyribonuclease V [Terriglobia bacterium]